MTLSGRCWRVFEAFPDVFHLEEASADSKPVCGDMRPQDTIVLLNGEHYCCECIRVALGVSRDRA